MKVIVFGATGMVGQGVLKRCLVDPEVTDVLAVGRRPSGVSHAKLRDLVHADFTDFTSVATWLTGYDACLFCLGISSLGMREADYRRITYDIPMAVARMLLNVSPGMTFIYVSGLGTDSRAQSKVMWARVKGEAENALLALPFAASYMFRPGLIQPKLGVRAPSRRMRWTYWLLAPLYPILRWALPGAVTSTDEHARAMLQVAKHGHARRVVSNADFPELVRATRTLPAPA